MYDGTIIERLIAAVERAEQETKCSVDYGQVIRHITEHVNARITEAEKILETAAKYQGGAE